MSKSKNAIPTINLKGGNFYHEVPGETNLEIIIHWKGKGYTPEAINPVKSFAIRDGELHITNRNLPDHFYSFNLKEVKQAYILPMEM